MPFRGTLRLAWRYVETHALKWRILACALSVLAAAMVSCVVLASPTVRHGDGFEYIYTAQAFLNHATPDVRASDISDAQHVLRTRNAHIKIKRDARQGFCQAPSGKFYSRHFWAYSMMVAPVQWMLRQLGLNELRAFTLFNVLIFLASVVVVVLFFPDGHDCGGWRMFALLTAIAPAQLYLAWPSPEVACASLMTCSLVAFARGAFPVSVLLSACASWQNPPCAFFAVYAGVHCRANWRRLVRGVLAGSCVLIPLAFNWLTFGCLNVIESQGGASWRFVSLDRLWSFWFDINQGLVVWSALPVLAFFFALSCGVARRRWNGMGAVAVVFLSVTLCATTINWNAGNASVIRYSVWVYPLVAFYVAQTLRWNGLLASVLVCGAVGQAFLCDWPRGNTRYLFHNAAARAVLDHFPCLYNPEHEIFKDRSAHVNQAHDGPYTYVLGGQEEGEVRKILMSASDVEAAEKDFDIKDRAYWNRMVRELTDRPAYINPPRGAVFKRRRNGQ